MLSISPRATMSTWCRPCTHPRKTRSSRVRSPARGRRPFSRTVPDYAGPRALDCRHNPDKVVIGMHLEIIRLAQFNHRNNSPWFSANRATLLREFGSSHGVLPSAWLCSLIVARSTSCVAEFLRFFGRVCGPFSSPAAAPGPWPGPCLRSASRCGLGRGRPSHGTAILPRHVAQSGIPPPSR